MNYKAFDIKKIIPIIMIMTLIIVTLLSVFVMDLPVSSELDTIETEYDNKKRTDYVDDTGKITIASDRQYATVIRTYDDKRMIEEEYFDDNGKKVESASGYHCLTRSYNEEGRADTDTYYDVKGEHVTSNGGYYAYKRKYNKDGKANEIAFLDISGNLKSNIYGFAAVRREFDKNGRVKREFYYDQNWEPTTSNIGQYGVYIEYCDDGKVSSRTYLNADGEPTSTHYGYVTTKYTYTDDNVLFETKYYDKDGNPTTGMYKEYGVRIEHGQTIYLDKNGKPMMRLDNFLNSHPIVVLVMGLCIMIAAFLIKGSSRWILIVLYICFIVYMTLWVREIGDTRSRFELFWSYKRFFIDPSLRKSVINNIWLFIPLGAMLYKPDSRRYLIPIFISIIIEAVQYKTGLGLCELDDVFSNSLGSFIGYSLAYLFHCYIPFTHSKAQAKIKTPL